ncbi:hypothetical protein CVT24_001240 [Panaeolus cyanescens]|uniref:Uncharacterized protein n=1 Tax=Panaeolus cyanescens TaxID=181874 RepID=A0A409YYY1_9AGAR|nr:hypothetical protein CVT24_001240 [Panaeolus cyanescens]
MSSSTGPYETDNYGHEIVMTDAGHHLTVFVDTHGNNDEALDILAICETKLVTYINQQLAKYGTLPIVSFHVEHVEGTATFIALDIVYTVFKLIQGIIGLKHLNVRYVNKSILPPPDNKDVIAEAITKGIYKLSMAPRAQGLINLSVQSDVLERNIRYMNDYPYGIIKLVAGDAKRIFPDLRSFTCTLHVVEPGSVYRFHTSHIDACRSAISEARPNCVVDIGILPAL